MIKLNEAQKAQALELLGKDFPIPEITKKVFENDNLDGRSKEGRAIIKFLAQNGLKAKTTARKPAASIELDGSQIEFIKELQEDGHNTAQIAAIIFKKDIKKLSAEWRAVNEVLKSNKGGEDVSDGSKYVPPQAVSRLIKKINDSTGSALEEDKLNRQERVCIDRLRVNLSNSRLCAIINNYVKDTDKILFEQEFIRLTWDKPDLTADEVNLYMNVAKEIINLELITGHLQKLNDMFETADDQDEMTVRLAEIIKAKSAEYHQCETRIENLTKKLQGDRGARLANKHKENASFLSIVQSFQEEEERQNMVRIAEMQKMTIREEAKRLEGMAAWKARILGIGIEDVV